MKSRKEKGEEKGENIHVYIHRQIMGVFRTRRRWVREKKQGERV
jgi:hypothetical protein